MVDVLESSGLTAEQVVLEAKNHWLEQVKYKLSQAAAGDQQGTPQPHSYSALDALFKLQREDYKDNPFWRNADMAQLERDVIALINSQFGSGFYELAMSDRDNDIPKLPHGPL
jgi:hypothetical protein